MKKILIFLLTLVLFSCGTESELKQIEFLFAPSFLYPSEFTIDVKKSKIEYYNYQSYYDIDVKIDSISSRTKRIDTLIVHYHETFNIEQKDLNNFLSELKLSRLDSTVVHSRPVLDGIGFRVSKINSLNDTISLTGSSPIRTDEYKMDYKILDAFFELIYKSITDYDGISKIENIQDYFMYGLPIKKIQDDPLEYRVWGSISGCREDNAELLKFLNELPSNEPILFDLRNGSIAMCLGEVFREYEGVKNMYYYGSSDFSYIQYQLELLEEKEELITDRVNDINLDNEIENLLIQAKPENWTKNKLIKFKELLNKRNSFETKDEALKTIANK